MSTVPHEMIGRIPVGGGVAALIAYVSWRAAWLTPGGAGAAFLVGTASFAAGWPWALLLIVFFLTSSVLSRARSTWRGPRDAEQAGKPGARDARQVLANGGIYALAATGAAWLGNDIAGAAALGALATATSDTWATEVGVRLGGIPRSLRTWQRIPRGVSGGITPAGTAAGLAGAAAIAVGASYVITGAHTFVLVALAGFAGMLTDSLLGATLQAARTCPTCNTATERVVHVCGTQTHVTSGLRWLDNDGVNVLATAAGAVYAAVGATLVLHA
jgi:uncharacterized protein (TIGR00297 family)